MGVLDKLFDTAVDAAIDVVTDPMKPVRRVAKGVEDGIAIIDGLSKGELQAKAAIKLGVNVATGMDLDELIAWYQALDDDEKKKIEENERNSSDDS